MANPFPDPIIEQRRRQRHLRRPPADYDPSHLEDGLMKSAMSHVHQTWSLLSEASRDNTLDDAQLSSLGERVFTRGLKSLDKVIATQEKKVENLAKDLHDYLHPPVSDTYGSEIRMIFKSLTPKGKDQTPSVMPKVVEAAKEDKRVATAVLTAPRILSGFSKDQLGIIKNQLIEHYCPDKRDALEAAQKELSLMTRARDRSLEEIGPWLAKRKAPTNASMAKLQEMANGT